MSNEDYWLLRTCASVALTMSWLCNILKKRKKDVTESKTLSSRAVTRETRMSISLVTKRRTFNHQFMNERLRVPFGESLRRTLQETESKKKKDPIEQGGDCD